MKLTDSPPNMIQLESSTACDAKCLFCPRPNMRRAGGVMDEWIFGNILDEAKVLNISQILLFLNGEPFLFPRLFDWLERLREGNFTSGIFTNAAHLTREKADALISYADVVKVVVFSVAGVDAETYQRIMGLDYEQVKKNIDYFLSINNGKIETYVHTVRMSMTIDFLDQWKAQWHGKVDHIGVAPMYNFAGLVSDSLVVKAGGDLIQVPCPRLQHLTILWDGRVCLCCMDAEGQVIVGDVKTQSLREIYYSELPSRYRQLHSEGRFAELPLCRDCNMNVIRMPPNEDMAKDRK
jgi:hypothetical protein